MWTEARSESQNLVFELVNTFRWGPVVLAVGSLQEEVLDVVWWRKRVGQTEHYEATGSQRHLSVQYNYTFCIMLCSRFPENK